MSLTMMQKRDDFAGYLEDLLQVHDASFTVDKFEREALEVGIDRATRVAITGDPVKYAYVHDIGQTSVLSPAFEADDGIFDYVGHTFEVRIFWGKTYSSTFASTSQKAFEDMCYNASDDASPGVLPTIRETRDRSVSGQYYQFGLPTQDAVQNVIRGSWDFGAVGQPELAHMLQFNIILL